MGPVEMDSQSPESLLRQHFFHPVGAGRFQPDTPDVVEGRAGSRKQGVAIQLQCRIDGDRIKEARFMAWGCPYSIAAASWLAGKLAGMGLDEASQIRGLALAEALEVPAERLGSILVVEDALRACLEKASGSRHV
jgi:NifU-like protein involved in Fe-S cluster formation